MLLCGLRACDTVCINSWDGDGNPELLVSSPEANGNDGEVWMLRFGNDWKVKRTARLDLQHQAQSEAGVGLATLPDLDGNAREDAAIGARVWKSGDGSGNQYGAVYIAFLDDVDGEVSVVSSTLIPGTGDGAFAAFTMTVRQRFGGALAGLGDLNGDGVVDVAIGAENADDGAIAGAGAVFLCALQSNGTVSLVNLINGANALPRMGVPPPGADDFFGESLSPVADLDGDGASELLVGARGSDDTRGYIVLLYMSPGPGAPTPRAAQRFSDDSYPSGMTVEAGARFGSSVWGYTVGDSIWFAVGALTQDVTAGAVYLVRLADATSISTVRTTKATDTIAFEDVDRYATIPLRQSPSGGFAAVARRCNAACAGDCYDASPLSCSGGMCAQGYALTTNDARACCPDHGVATWWDTDSERCGDCDPSCAACDGPSEVDCTSCAAGCYHTPDGRCVEYSQCDAATEFVLVAATNSSDVVCGACASSCVTGAGCTGPAHAECAAVAVTARSLTTVEWASPRHAVGPIAAALLPGNTAPVIGAELDTRRRADGRIHIFVLTQDGTLWDALAAITQASPAMASPRLPWYRERRPTAAFALDAPHDAAYFVGSTGAVARFDLRRNVSRLVVPSNGQATAVAVSTDGVHIYYSTASGYVERAVSTYGGGTTVVLRVPEHLATVVSMGIDDSTPPGRVLLTDSAGSATIVDLNLERITVNVTEAISARVPAVAAAVSIGRGEGRSDVVVVERLLRSDSAASLSRVAATHAREWSFDTQGSVPEVPAGIVYSGGCSNGRCRGDALSAIGDVDGDGVGEIVVGITASDGSGAFKLLRMEVDGSIKGVSTMGPAVNVDEPWPAKTLASPNHQAGVAVSGMPDWDGDGVADVLVGMPGASDLEGAFCLCFLNSGGASIRVVRCVTAQEMGMPLGSQAQVGKGLSALADVNGDGTADAVVGATRADPSDFVDRGAIFVVLLEAADDGSGLMVETPSGDFYQLIQQGVAGFSPADPSNGMYFGTSIASLGDVSGDGMPDIAVGARSDDDGPGVNGGAVYVMALDISAALPTIPSGGTLKLSAVDGGLRAASPSGDGDSFGESVCAVPDLDGDGKTAVAHARHPCTCSHLGCCSYAYNSLQDATSCWWDSCILELAVLL